MSLNFAISSNSAVRNTRRPLAPWAIHTVKFNGAEIREFDGKKDPKAHYKLLTIKYENEDGYFSIDLFFPKDSDTERPQYDSADGGKITYPSSFETTMAIIKQTAQVLNPSGFEKMQKISSKFKSFDDVANTFIKIMQPVVGKETQIKLTGRNRDGKVVAQIPRIVGISKKPNDAGEYEAYISDNYIGEKLFWSDYEMGKKKEFDEAAPTEVTEDKQGVDETPNNDIDIASLLD